MRHSGMSCEDLIECLPNDAALARTGGADYLQDAAVACGDGSVEDGDDRGHVRLTTVQPIRHVQSSRNIMLAQRERRQRQ